jgi:RNA polymerase sigma-70 factor, ECF subfamily
MADLLNFVSLKAGSMTTPPDVTQLLIAWSDGDREAFEKLVPLVQAELHKLAERYMRGQRPGHTLQATALVNEAFLKLIDWKNVRWQNRAHFFGVSAQVMRSILVDFARRRPRTRQGKAEHLSLDEALTVSEGRGPDIVALDDALKALKEIDPRKSQIVELRYFGGLNVDETAEVMGIAPITVMREWNKAKAWLYRELSADEKDR